MFTKIKQVVLLTLLVCAVQPVYANNTFTIEDYVPLKFTDLMWKLDGDIRGSARNSKRGSEGQLSFDSFGKENKSSYSFRLSSTMKYENETLEDYLKTSLFIQTSFNSWSSDYYNRREHGIPTNQSNLVKEIYSRKDARLRFSPQTTYKKYFVNDIFYSVFLSGSFDYNFSVKDELEHDEYNYYYVNNWHYNNINSSFQKSDIERRRNSASFNFLIGDGRQYVGKLSFTAYNMIEELKKKGLLLKQPDKTIMMALTDIIYQYENSHTIDKRLKKIEKYDVIYSFLLDNKIVKENKHIGMLLVQDAFDMFPRELRRFGFSKSIGVGFKYYYRGYDLKGDKNSQILSYQYESDTPYNIDTTQNYTANLKQSSHLREESLLKYIIALFSYNKPINMKWQIDASATARYYFDSYEKNSTNIQKKYDFKLTNKVTYFYSSRTIWWSSVSYGYLRNKIDYNNNYPYSDRDNKRWNFSLSSNLEYRLNIPTIIRARIQYRNSDDENIYNDNLSYSEYSDISFSISLSHFIY